MTATNVIRRLHQHRAWVNQNLLQAAANLSDDQLRQSLSIGQGSVWKSLCHMQAAEYVWLGALLGDEDPLLPGDVKGKLPGNQLGEGGFTGLNDLSEKWAVLERRWSDYLTNLNPDSLDDVVYKVSSSNLGRFGTKRSDILLHVCTHAHYTAAQVVNMFRQLGVEKLPASMVVIMAMQETA